MSKPTTDYLQPIKDRLSARPAAVWGWIDHTMYANGEPYITSAQVVEEDADGNIVRVLAEELSPAEADFIANAPCDIGFLIEQLEKQTARANDYKNITDYFNAVLDGHPAKRAVASATTAPPPKRAEADNVNHPAHYTAGSIECIEALEAATTGLAGVEAFCTANAIKYLWRWKRKNGAEDLNKAIWYINHILSRLEGTT